MLYYYYTSLECFLQTVVPIKLAPLSLAFVHQILFARQLSGISVWRVYPPLGIPVIRGDLSAWRMCTDKKTTQCSHAWRIPIRVAALFCNVPHDRTVVHQYVYFLLSFVSLYPLGIYNSKEVAMYDTIPFLFAEPRCRNGMVYREDLTGCPPTCSDPNGERNCIERGPREGCACPQGQILSGRYCIPISMCGCTDEEGFYREVRRNGFI